MAQATITWTPASGTGNQRVYYKVSSASAYTLFSTVAFGINTATITGLQNNVIYNFKIENNCGTGTVGESTSNSIFITCPTVSTTPTATSIAYSYATGAAGSAITGYVVELLDASNNVLQTNSQSPNLGSTNTGTFNGLTPQTSYKIRVTVNAGSFTNTCTASTISTANTEGLLINNIDYSTDVVNNFTSGQTVVALYDNSAGAYVVGNLTNNSLFSGVTSGTSQVLDPIPPNDSFVVYTSKKGQFTPSTPGTDAWIQLRNASNTTVDLDPTGVYNEVQNNVDLTGFGLATHWTINVRQSVKFAPFPVAVDTAPGGGGTHITQLTGYIQNTGAGAIVNTDGTRTPILTGVGGATNYDAYPQNIRLNPFLSVYNGNILASAADLTPDGADNPFNANNSYPMVASINGLTYYFPSDPASSVFGERFIPLSFSNLMAPSNQGIVSQDPTFGNTPPYIDFPTVNSVTRSGNVISINHSWQTPVSGSSRKYDFYIAVIKDQGLAGETVTHYPIAVAWPADPAFIPFAYSQPTTASTLTVTKTITVPTSFTSLKVRVVTLLNTQITGNVEGKVSSHAQLFNI